MAGADLLTVSKLMAHTDINTTIKHYGHLQPNMARKWVNEFAKMTNDSPIEEIPVKNHLSQVS
jgi:integrase